MDTSELPFSVYTADNFDYGGRHYDDGRFATAQEAILRARIIVNSCLHELHRPDMKPGDLRDSFMNFGEIPMISGPEPVDFNAQEFIDQRCLEIERETSAR